ncbi:RNA-binding S4 domain-containing protein [Qipengyuania oceanensis]|uniref:RNA-binding S4 domain-containing protein n=1 Tax=Qipengyuania oceanensis TaxID=1463597 RepID=A0A844YGJ7_9SPHN|nr:RNA-binding S4 domain-containing protein [Qipengyuania oceanensis]MXO63067.1 RNA-binding S4 domain-containing protein [Qipengyuania oceanensis]
MRLDLALFWLRFSKSRSIARRLVEEGHVRCNGQRVSRPCHAVAAGDVLTIPLPGGVRIIEITSLPARRGPASEAQGHYRALDPAGESKLAAGSIVPIPGENRP